MTELPAAVRAAGWRVLVLDLAGVEDRAGLMERCVRDLEPEDWFGRNWDALLDMLADLPAASPNGVLLVVTHWTGYAQARPEEWRIAQEVFADAVERGQAHDGPPLEIVLDFRR